MIDFEWDEQKALINLQEHGIAFKKAVLLFLDDKRIVFVDKRNDYGEERLITMGMIEKRLHVLVYTERGKNIRIISARKANTKEQKRYANR